MPLETCIDYAVYYLFSIFSGLSFPVLKYAITHIDWALYGATQQQLMNLDKTCYDFLVQIKNQKQELAQLTAKQQENKKPRVTRIRQQIMNTTAGIQLRKDRGREPIYFQHSIWYNTTTNNFSWQAKGDDSKFSDQVYEVKIVDKNQFLLQIELDQSNETKIVRFNSFASMSEWHGKISTTLESL